MKELASVVEKSCKLARSAGYLAIVAWVAVCLLPPVGGFAAEQKPAAAPTSAETRAAATEPAAAAPAAVIPVAEIATRATEVANLIRSFATNLAPSGEIATIEKFLPQVSANITLELAATVNMLQAQPSLEALQSEEQLWHQRQVQLSTWLNLLTDRATKLQDALHRLTEQQETWARTRDAEQMSKAPAPILEQIEAVLASIEATQPPHRAQRDEILDVQSKIAQEVARCGTVLAQIGQFQKRAVEGILVREVAPIWSAELWAGAQATLLARLPKIGASYWNDFQVYLSDPSKRMPVHVGLFIVLSLASLAARRQVEQWAATGEGVARATVVFNHPIAAALLLSLMAASSIAAPTPTTVKQLFVAAVTVPMIIFTRPVVYPMLVPLLYTTAVLFALDTVRHASAGVSPVIGQSLIFIESAVGIAVLASLLIYGSVHRAFGETADSGWRMVRRFLAGLILCVLAIGLLASAFGFLRLARLTTPGVIGGGVLALWWYAVVQVASGFLAYAFRVRPLRLLRMVQHHREFIEARIYRLMLWVVSLGWLYRYLEYLGLWDPVLNFAQALLTTKLERGSFSTSPEDILAFFITVYAAFLLSRLIRFVLEEDVYPRAGIPAGLSYALSSLLNYVIVTVGFIVALALLGVTLTQVTVLAGAFGVGIGFGLQSVVNNFVCGLILLFERPIHVGDTVQVGSLQGRVRRIGIRASIVRTTQGAEIIVPNAQLITEQVTNWTLSDQLRRIDLPVGVNYGAAPKKVIDLLETAARAHPQVIANPPPRALFMNYGDSSINFELRAWTDFANSVQVHSDLIVAVYEAVYAAGMSFPFPQRDVRVLRDADAAPDAKLEIAKPIAKASDK